MFPPSMKFDILVGLASILGKLMLVDRLGSSLLGLRISRLLGFGSFILESLETHFPELCRLAVSVFPSEA